MKFKDSFGSWKAKWFYLTMPEESNLTYFEQPAPSDSFKIPLPRVHPDEIKRLAGIRVMSRHHLSTQAIVQDFLENRISPLRKGVHPFFSITE